MEWLEYCKTFIPKIKEKYKKRLGKDLDLENPKTLSEKIQWLKIYDSTFIKAYCADKITLHDYCKEKIVKDICIPILAVYDKPEDINYDNLPNKFIIKCNHGSEMNLIITDKNKINKDSINKQIEKWLSIKYGDYGYELHYNLIKPKVFIEEFKDNGINGLIDYKFWCFNGEPKFYSINGGHGHGYITYFNLDKTVSKIQRIQSENKKEAILKQPKNFEKMFEYAKTLSKDFKLVRVDFYEIDNEVFLGELTFTPGDGYFNFDNNGDLEFGKMLDL